MSSGRLLVDATSTVRIDHGTGIQRVTKQITSNLLRQDAKNNIIIYCDSEDGFLKARSIGKAPLYRLIKSENGKNSDAWW